MVNVIRYDPKPDTNACNILEHFLHDFLVLKTGPSKASLSYFTVNSVMCLARVGSNQFQTVFLFYSRFFFSIPERRVLA